MVRPVAESQLAATPWQPLAVSHQGPRLVYDEILGKGILAIPNYQRTSKDMFSSPLQFALTKGVSFEIQDPRPRSFQPQSLVTGKMLHPLIVSQDLMRAMRQHRDIFATDPTIEMARFAGRVSSPSHEKLTHFVRSPHVLHFECALRTHTTTGVTGL